MTPYPRLVAYSLALGLAGAALAQPPEIPDTRVLIDVSGSMKQNDPQNLRQPALRLLVGLLPEGSKAGVWTFAQQVNLQVPLGEVNRAWKDKAAKGAAGIHSLGLYTNIEDALIRATEDWTGPDPGHQRHLVLLTDGVVDVSKNPDDSARSRERIFSQLIPNLRRVGARVHTVALSDRADHELMSALSKATKGWYEQVDNADMLQRVFLRIFEKVGNPDTLPLSDNKFRIDNSIREVTLLVFRPADAPPTRLVTPDGEELEEAKAPANVRWHRDEGFDLLTISEPQAGEWGVRAKLDPDNRVMILTDLRMDVGELPARMVQGQGVPLAVEFLDQGARVTRKDFLDVVQVHSRQVGPGGGAGAPVQLRDDGGGDDPMAQDGRFELRFAPRGGEGRAELIVTAQGKTFQREKRRIFELLAPAQALLEPESAAGGEGLRLRVHPAAELIDPATFSASAELVGSAGGRTPLELTRAPDGYFEARLSLATLAGPHDLRVSVEARTLEGGLVQTALPAIGIVGQLPETAAAPSAPPPPPSGEVTPEAEPPAEDDPMTGMLLFAGGNLVLVLLGLGVYLVLRRRSRKDPFTLVDETESADGKSEEQA